MRKGFRFILFPFSFLYGSAVFARNKLFDKKILRSASFDFPVICVGNLSTGGTGKSPMVEYLVDLLQKNYKVATLSRGYKRKKRGFLIADEKTVVTDVGDEPMQFHKKFPEITVAVAEERVMGIPKLLFEKPETEVIILDDAFQHREVKAGLNILLTDFNNLYTEDVILPVGNLRDLKSSSKRADIIVVTKCKPSTNINDKQLIINKLSILPEQTVYFAKISYGDLYGLVSGKNINPEGKYHVLLVTGIANSNPLVDYIAGKFSSFSIVSFKDHHNYSKYDVDKIKNQFSKISQEKIIVTTEKDAVRLAGFSEEFENLPVFVLPMKHEFLFGEKENFDKQILNFVAQNKI